MEDILHVLRGCSAAKDVWSQVLLVNHHDTFFSASLPVWFVSNLQNDVAVKLDSRLGGARGVLQNEAGEWIIGYNRHVGKWLVFDAELWGILDGLGLLQWQGYNKVVIILIVYR
ncbi:hypothetical protein Goari_014442 [Gossypium aridum]|uniref:RNase H type-1 domain-containing protein n=1 Tax=Gossypium aridum TaxID=34290 RepID=A0A7J8XHW6_GOSAI|nr:hypothetical protein [Gossypium aridum]